MWYVVLQITLVSTITTQKIIYKPHSNCLLKPSKPTLEVASSQLTHLLTTMTMITIVTTTTRAKMMTTTAPAPPATAAMLSIGRNTIINHYTNMPSGQ